MILTEQVTDKLNKLPMTAQEEVLDFIDFLLQKSTRQIVKQRLNGVQKAKAIEQWAKNHSLETPVILDDSREAIYEN